MDYEGLYARSLVSLKPTLFRYELMYNFDVEILQSSPHLSTIQKKYPIDNIFGDAVTMFFKRLSHQRR